jgi:hypothetical protein
VGLVRGRGCGRQSPGLRLTSHSPAAMSGSGSTGDRLPVLPSASITPGGAGVRDLRARRSRPRRGLARPRRRGSRTGLDRLTPSRPVAPPPSTSPRTPRTGPRPDSARLGSSPDFNRIPYSRSGGHEGGSRRRAAPVGDGGGSSTAECGDDLRTHQFGGRQLAHVLTPWVGVGVLWRGSTVGRRRSSSGGRVVWFAGRWGCSGVVRAT